MKLKTIPLLAAMAFCFAASTSKAEEKPVLGLLFGQALDRFIPECLNNASTGDDYCSRGKAIDRATPPLGAMVMAPTVTSKFNLPEWMLTNRPAFLYFNKEGALTGIEVDTTGPDQQERIINSITERYGTPTSKVDREVQNAYGAKWQVSKAHWDTHNMVVRFDCIDRTTCRVGFKSPKLETLEKRAFDEKQKKDKL